MPLQTLGRAVSDEALQRKSRVLKTALMTYLSKLLPKSQSATAASSGTTIRASVEKKSVKQKPTKLSPAKQTGVSKEAPLNDEAEEISKDLMSNIASTTPVPPLQERSATVESTIAYREIVL